MRFNNLSLFFTFLLFGITSVVYAATITSNQTGNWNSTSSWIGGVIPGASDDVIIQNGHDITVTVSTSCNSIRINGSASTSSIVVNNSITLTVSSNFYSVAAANNDFITTTINGTLTCGRFRSYGEFGFSNYTHTIDGSGSVTASTDILFLCRGVNSVFNISVDLTSSKFAGQITYNGGYSQTINLNAKLTAATDYLFQAQGSSTAANTVLNVTNSGSELQLGRNISMFDNGGTLTGSATNGKVSFGNGGTINTDSKITYGNIEILTGTTTLGGDLSETKMLGDLTITGTLNTNGNDISISGDLVHNGNLTMSSGDKISLAGNAAQTITVGGSASSIGGLEIANTSGGVSISGSNNLEISEQVYFDAVGTTAFTTNGKLTLLDQGSGMANLGNLNNHTISGNITCQYNSGAMSTTDYRLMSMPVSGVTIGDVQYHVTNQANGFETYGFTGSNTPSAGSFFSTYTYNNTNVGTSFSEGFVGATGTGNSLNHQAATTWYVGPGNAGGTKSYSFDVTGTPNTNTVTINAANGANMTHSGSAFDFDKEWVLVGNPYPSTVTLAAGNFSNIDPAVWQFKADAGGYVDDKTLPPFQGFYVWMTGGAASITFNESDKVTTQKVYQKSGKEDDLVKIYITSEHTNRWSFTSVQMKDGATNNYEAGLDAGRMINPKPFPNIALITDDKVASQRYIGNNSDGHLAIPLNTTTYKSGNHQLRFENTNDLNGCMVLEDTYENKMITIDDINTTYFFYLSDTVKNDRFVLHIYNFTKEVNTLNSSCFASNNGIAELELYQLESGFSYTMSDNQGKAIRSEFDVKGKQTIKNLAPGNYTMEIQSIGLNCPSEIEYITILEPSKMTPSFGFKEKSTVFYTNKEIVFENSSEGGMANYLWDFGDNSSDSRKNPTHIYGEPGIYSVSLTAQNGNSDCNVSTSRSIKVVDAYLSISEESDNNINVVQSENSLNVTSESSFTEYQIIDLSGKSILFGNLENQNNFEVNTSELQNGIYILHLIGAENPFTLKFYKK